MFHINNKQKGAKKTKIDFIHIIHVYLCTKYKMLIFYLITLMWMDIDMEIQKVALHVQMK